MADTMMPAPPNGETIRIVDGKLVVPDNPIVPVSYTHLTLPTKRIV